MRDFLKSVFYNKKLHVRFACLVVLFLIVFSCAAILSYYLLPEGFLLGKNSISDWDTSSSMIVSAIQIFLFNLISALLIVFANFFAFPSKAKAFMPLGYWCLIILLALNGITLGTWSFTVSSTVAPDLATRLLGTFDVFHRAGLWEIVGQLSIASATARIAIISKGDNDESIHALREVKLGKTEIICIALGICLMLIGAFVESNAIIGQM